MRDRYNELLKNISQITSKAGVHMNAISSSLNVGLPVVSLLHLIFKQCKKLSAHLINVCFAVFCKFLGDFLKIV